MMAIYLWAIGALGFIGGLGVGAAWGYTRGVDNGIRVGFAQRIQEQEAWDDLVRRANRYDRLIPHGNPGHSCTEKCVPPEHRKWLR